jgi:hypothetical protein
MLDILKWENLLLKAVAAHQDRPRNKNIPGIDSLSDFATLRKFSTFKTICTVLKPVCHMIDDLEGDSYPTLSLVQTLAYAIEVLSSFPSIPFLSLYLLPHPTLSLASSDCHPECRECKREFL